MKDVSAMCATIRRCAFWLALACATQACFSQEAAGDHVFANGFEDIVFADGFEPAGPTFGDAQMFTLALPPAPSPVSIVLDKIKLNSVLNATEQQQLVLRNVDPAPAISTTLTTLVNQCGTGWQFDNANPNYDCSATGWVGPGGDWQTSGEYILVKLLTLTPAHTIVAGTIVQNLDVIASDLAIGGGAQQMLSDLLGIARTAVLTTRADFVTKFISNVVATHPNAPAGTLPLRFYDAMNNMTPWTALLGPVGGGHAGIIDPEHADERAGPGRELLDHLRAGRRTCARIRVWCSGPASASAGTLAAIVDTTGPHLHRSRRARARRAVAGRVHVACNGDGHASIPGEGAGELHQRVHDLQFLLRSGQHGVGAAGVVAGAPRDDRGPVALDDGRELRQVLRLVRSGGHHGLQRRSCGVDAVPTPSWESATRRPHHYVWEMVDELEQVAVHRDTQAVIAEGAANIAWTSPLDVTVSSSTLATVVAPALAAHASQIATLAAGNWQAGNADVDLYLRAGEDGSVQLWFPAASDPRPTATYPYTSVGFFDDLALSVKASATSIAGTSDTEHEKLVLAPGTRVVYAQAATGATWRVSVTYAGERDDRRSRGRAAALNVRLTCPAVFGPLES
jgi:hypothetical protein